jgi:hypothetical protein
VSDTKAEASAQVHELKPKHRFRLERFDDIEVGTEPDYLIEGFIPRVGITVVWGPPKTLKTFWVLDTVMHVALGWEYRGRDIQAGPVVYFAFEGAHGFRKRAAAFREQFLPEDHDTLCRSSSLQPTRDWKRTARH